MTENPISYFFSCIFVTVAHLAMLANIWVNGKYDSPSDVLLLGGAVILLDFVWYIAMLFFKQKTFALSFLLILILNMSVIFQSCFGGVELDKKHYITCIAALIASRLGYHLCRDHKRLASHKLWIYAGIGVLTVAILTLTGSRSIWISLGPITIQPSEFIKPLFALACATTVGEQMKKHKLLMFNVVWDNLIVLGIFFAICFLQWWCRDLGSLPTFAGIYASGFLLRICYPRAKFSKKTLIAAAAAVIAAAAVALKFAPAYVQDRLHSDIWSDVNGNGWQQSRALIGIAKGSWMGRGPGMGDLHSVFAHENDIVFATVSEEWGLLYALMMILVILIILAVPLINPPRSYFHATMVSCICAAITVQTALNIFGSCNLIPFTGVTIPFISTGGSSMMTSGFMVGMLMASQNPDLRPPKAERKRPVPIRSEMQ